MMSTTKINIQQVVDAVSKASKTLMFSEPFYGLFLIGLNKKYRNDIPTAGVSMNGIGVQLATQSFLQDYLLSTNKGCLSMSYYM